MDREDKGLQSVKEKRLFDSTFFYKPIHALTSEGTLG